MAHVLRRTPTHSFLEWSPKVANLVVGSLAHSRAQIIETLLPSERKYVWRGWGEVTVISATVQFGVWVKHIRFGGQSFATIHSDLQREITIASGRTNRPTRAAGWAGGQGLGECPEQARSMFSIGGRAVGVRESLTGKIAGTSRNIGGHVKLASTNFPKVPECTICWITSEGFRAG